MKTKKCCKCKKIKPVDYFSLNQYHCKECASILWRLWKDKNRPDIIKYCESCGKQFIQKSNSQKRCQKCRNIKCESCDNLFLPLNSTLDHKYCSILCKAESQKGAEPLQLKAKRGRKPRTYHLTKREKHGNAYDREWREAIFKRDDWTCQNCYKKGGKLEAHHIKPFKKHPELRLDLGNGLTLCIACHRNTDSYGWKNYWKNCS